MGKIWLKTLRASPAEASTAYIKDMMYEWCVCYDSAKVVATDVIIAGAAYDLME